MRRGLRRIHQIIGVVGALYMLVMASTGTILAFEDNLLRLLLPGLDRPVVQLSPAEQGAKLGAIEAAYANQGLRSIQLPTDGMNAYRVYLVDKSQQLLDAETLVPIHDPMAADASLQFLFDIHHYLALGDTGKQIIGLLGLAAIFSVLSGLYLWWPWRRGFRLSLLKARGGSSAAHRGAHATMGILLAPLLLVTVVTGTVLIYSGPVRAGLAALFGGAQPTQQAEAGAGGPERLFELAAERLPGAEASIYSPARMSMRLRMQDEWLPKGRSTVTVGPDGAVVYDATKGGMGHRISDAVYPVHAGKVGGALWLAIVVLTGFGTIYLSAMGFLAFWRRARPRRPRV
ncbi:MAG: PepSY domain-containing protein [Alphaproteobacteria bacterium]|nr:MAG: PepSY domain-containing protein [Alphaproteobacteria bacterium]